MTAALPSPAHGLSARTHYLPIGIGAAVVQSLMMLPGYSEDGFDSAWYGMAALSLVVAVLVFTLAVPNGGGTTAIVLGVLAGLGAFAFWTMLCFPFAAGAVVVGRRARANETDRTRGTVGVVVGVLAAVAVVLITIGDMMAN